MERPISKTDFLDYVFCAKNLWLKKHKPELLEQFALSDYEKHLAEEGNEVEAHARGLFPPGAEVTQWGMDAVEETRRLMEAKTPAIFQATFNTEGFLARNDALVYNAATESWDLYEIKGTSGLHETGSDRNHLDDITFQASVLRRSGAALGSCYLVHLSSDYVRVGELDVQTLFKIENVTEKVAERLSTVETQMETAREYLARETEPVGGCECIYRGRSSHCTTFRYSNPTVPEYSIHDLSRIGSSKKKLLQLVENKQFELADVPEDMELSDIQQNQIRVHVRATPIIDPTAIAQELEPLQFPLYFLDYETFSPAVPLFSGYRPFDKVPFQFSLHILRTPGAELEHVEYLHMESSDPTAAVIALLQQHIGEQGTIIAWNKSFETDVHKRMARRVPDHAPSLERMNAMFYDLKDVFHKQYYVHPDFRGSTSIKYILPALVPELQYKDLGIHGGAQASDAWWKMVSPEISDMEREQIATDLKTYCGLDTYAMYAIWKHVQEIIG